MKYNSIPLLTALLIHTIIFFPRYIVSVEMRNTNAEKKQIFVYSYEHMREWLQLTSSSS